MVHELTLEESVMLSMLVWASKYLRRTYRYRVGIFLCNPVRVLFVQLTR